MHNMLRDIPKNIYQIKLLYSCEIENRGSREGVQVQWLMKSLQILRYIGEIITKYLSFMCENEAN